MSNFFKIKAKKWKNYFTCPKKVESFHRFYGNRSLEKGLVLWSATSEVKMEARFEISVKFCLKYSSEGSRFE